LFHGDLAVFSSYLWYYTSVLNNDEKKYRFCALVEPYVKQTYRYGRGKVYGHLHCPHNLRLLCFLTPCCCRCFQLSLVSYGVAFSRIGWVYYADTRNRFLPMTAIIIGDVLFPRFWTFLV
jgi:hypothetical protein